MVRRAFSRKAIPEETEVQKEGYRFYYLLGPSRTFRAVAKQIGHNLNAVLRWSYLYDWKERIVKEEAAELREKREGLEVALGKTKQDYRDIINTMMSDFKKALKDKKIKIKDAYQLEKIVKLDLLLMGEPTEREEHRVIFEDVEATYIPKKETAPQEDTIKALSSPEEKDEQIKTPKVKVEDAELVTDEIDVDNVIDGEEKVNKGREEFEVYVSE